MPEEFEMIEQEPQNEGLSKSQLKNQRNAANNAKAVSAALEAGKTKNPYIAAAAAADRLTGGRLSNAAGKALNVANKISPGGRIGQAILNKAGESGATDRIGQALSKKNGSTPANGNVGGKSDASIKNKNNGFFSKKEVQDQTSDGGGVSFQATAKFLKVGLIAFAPVMIVVVFMNLIVAGSQTYLQVIGLGQADKVSSEKAEEAISEHASEDLLNEETDFDDNPDGEAGNLTGYIYIDDFIEDSITREKFSKMNFVATIKSRPYNEAELTELKDYYSDISSYENGNYDMDTVYNFFFKLLYIQKHYKNSYGIDLDMPLIMSILTVQSTDINEVFVSNTKQYKINSLLNGKKENNKYFKYDYDWSKYQTSEDVSLHDIEILARGMVKKTSDSGCPNGACYELVSEDEYKVFLKTFLSVKYFGQGSIIFPGLGNAIGGISPINPENPLICEDSFTKYDLTDDQVRQIASLAYHEQGTAKGAAAEASLMANLFEIKGKKYGTGAQGLYNYVRNSGWFAYSQKYMDSYDASEAIVAAVKSVLVDGKRTIPAYIDEHDYFGDINSAKTEGKTISVSDKTKYLKNNTVIKNKYGATYTFYSFPDTNSDPFGYTSEAIRTAKGEFYYDYDTGNPVNCNNNVSNDSSVNINYVDALLELANKELELNKDKNGAKYNKYFGYSESDPWCANFVSYLIDNTKVNGISMYPNIIDYKTASTGSFMKHFDNSKKSNLKFYYNSNCDKLKNKNDNSIYIPKRGDLIFFDWEKTFTSISRGGQDHVGIVEKYENGYIYTIEGNSSNRIKKLKYSISSCGIIGFGSWY